VAVVEKDRIKLAVSCARAWQAVLVLKGVPTVVAWPDGTYYLNTTGNASMATGGSGDVLTGMIAALVAQGMQPGLAALAGVYLHGAAGDVAAASKVGLAAGEIAAAVPQARYIVEKSL
jgi:NAD(P)H-hydrate repair Nnr-like enzyme with NAD(P)H-hydrate dehydratase domain